MMEEENAKRRKIVFLLLSFILLIVAIGYAYTAVDGARSSSIRSAINYSDISLENSKDKTAQAMFMEKISNIIKSLNRLDNNPNIIYRNLSVKQISGSRYSVDGIVDVPAIKQTYLAKGTSDAVFLGCPTPEISAYPDSFCIGAVESYEDDSIYALFGTELPMSAQLSADVKMRIYQKNHAINAQIYACSSDNLKSMAKSYIEKLVLDRGGNPSIFPINYSFNSCK